MSEQWGRRLDDRFQTRLLFAAWLIPAAGLVVSASVGLGFRSTSVDAGTLVARTQAVVLVLAVVTALMALRCAIVRLPAGGFQPARSRLGFGGLLCFVAAVGLAGAATINTAVGAVVVPAAALAGLGAGVCWALCLYRLPVVDPGRLVGLSAVVAGQLTVGWLPVVEPTLASSPVPLMLGLLLAVSAVRAATTTPFVSLAASASPALDLDRPLVDRAGGHHGSDTVDLSVDATGPAMISLR